MKMITVDDIIEYCHNDIVPLSARHESVAVAALRRVINVAKEYAVEAEPVINVDQIAALAHKRCMIIAENPNSRNKTGVLCDRCGNELTVAYHENRLYSVHCWRCGIVSLVTAGDQKKAVEKVVE